MSRNSTPYDVNERTIFITEAARGIIANRARALDSEAENYTARSRR